MNNKKYFCWRKQTSARKLDTKGLFCFLCLKGGTKLNRDYGVLAKEGDPNEEEQSLTGFKSISLRSLCICLQIYCNRSGGIYDPNSCPDKNEGGGGDVEVDLCGPCGELISKFSNLFQQLETVQMKVNECLEQIHGRIPSENQVKKSFIEYSEELVRNYSRRMTTAGSSQQPSGAANKDAKIKAEEETLLARLKVIGDLRKKISSRSLKFIGVGPMLRVDLATTKLEGIQQNQDTSTSSSAAAAAATATVNNLKSDEDYGQVPGPSKSIPVITSPITITTVSPAISDEIDDAADADTDNNTIDIEYVLPSVVKKEKVIASTSSDKDNNENELLEKENSSTVQVQAGLVKTEQIHALRGRTVNRYKEINVDPSTLPRITSDTEVTSNWQNHDEEMTQLSLNNDEDDDDQTVAAGIAVGDGATGNENQTDGNPSNENESGTTNLPKRRKVAEENTISVAEEPRRELIQEGNEEDATSVATEVEDMKPDITVLADATTTTINTAAAGVGVLNSNTPNVEETHPALLQNFLAANLKVEVKAETAAPPSASTVNRKRKIKLELSPEEICQRLRDAVILVDRQSIESLLQLSEVQEVLKRSTSGNNKNNYPVAASLIGNCVAESWRDDEEKIKTKKKIMKAFTSVNNAMLDYTNLNWGIPAPILRFRAHPKLISTLIKLGANPLAIDDNRMDGRGDENPTILHRLCSESDTEDFIIQFLGMLSPSVASALVKIRCSKGNTPLLKLIENYRLPLSNEILEVFRLAGADANAENLFKKSPFVTAIAQRRDVAVIRKLVGLGGNLAWKGERDSTILHFAAKKVNFAALEYFIEKLHLDVNIEDWEGLTPFDYLAFKCGQSEAANSAEDYLTTATMLERFNGRIKIQMPLHHALSLEYFSQPQNNVRRTVKLLLHLEFAVNKKDEKGNTPLHLICGAMINYNKELSYPHLAGGAPPRRHGKIPCARKRTGGIPYEAMRYAKPSTSMRSKDQEVAFHRALPIIKDLLNHGADVNAINLEGQTPLEIVTMKKEFPSDYKAQIKNIFKKED